jgi:hypothetical protein
MANPGKSCLICAIADHWSLALIRYNCYWRPIRANFGPMQPRKSTLANSVELMWIKSYEGQSVLIVGSQNLGQFGAIVSHLVPYWSFFPQHITNIFAMLSTMSTMPSKTTMILIKCLLTTLSNESLLHIQYVLALHHYPTVNHVHDVHHVHAVHHVYLVHQANQVHLGYPKVFTSKYFALFHKVLIRPMCMLLLSTMLTLSAMFMLSTMCLIVNS